MEIIFGIIGIILVLWIIEVLNDWRNSINWGKFLGTLIIGSIVLGVLFSFTAEGVLVIIGAYIVLIIVALLFGSFNTKNNSSLWD